MRPIFLLLAVLGLVTIWFGGALVRSHRARRIARHRVSCPLYDMPAHVDFRVDAGVPLVYRDVAACSLIPPGEPPSCGKACHATSLVSAA
jgi:hypothetical protein